MVNCQKDAHNKYIVIPELGVDDGDIDGVDDSDIDGVDDSGIDGVDDSGIDTVDNFDPTVDDGDPDINAIDVLDVDIDTADDVDPTVDDGDSDIDTVGCSINCDEEDTAVVWRTIKDILKRMTLPYPIIISNTLRSSAY